MKAGKIVLALFGALGALAAIGMLVGGGVLLWVYGTQRDADGFFTLDSAELSTDAYALTSEEVDLGSRPGDWWPSGRLATVRLEIVPQGGSPVFVGIGPTAQVDLFLKGVAHTVVTDIPRRGDVEYRKIEGGPPSAPASDQLFWAKSSQGAGPQNLTWDLEQGEWTAVIMNSDASPGITVDAEAGAKTSLLIPTAVGLIVGGLVFGSLAAFLLVIATRQPSTPAIAGAQPGTVAMGAPGQLSTTGVGAATLTGAATKGTGPQTTGFGRYPVRLEGKLDPNLSRWLWLVKWFLIIPHAFVLIFLWMAFAILTFAAGVSILFTGRYPRQIFEFNVGVMRWTWRVVYYSYSALGTDLYPPFTLAETDYPASLDVAYPSQLSQGLVLVKWWLLAIPHYLIVGLLSGSFLWWAGNGDGSWATGLGGGLIGLLALIAGLSLAFTSRYPQGLFDLVMGLNRWIFRVVAYAALMRDEYPPFRLDSGGTEPSAIPISSPRTGSEGEITPAP